MYPREVFPHMQVLFLFLVMCECLSLCGFVHPSSVPMETRMGALEPLDLKVQTVVSYQHGCQEPNSMSFEKPVCMCCYPLSHPIHSLLINQVDDVLLSNGLLNSACSVECLLDSYWVTEVLTTRDQDKHKNIFMHASFLVGVISLIQLLIHATGIGFLSGIVEYRTKKAFICAIRKPPKNWGES